MSHGWPKNGISNRYEKRRSLLPAIIDQVKSAMAAGLLEPGERLPTVRQLAVNLSVNPNTVSRAYTELELTGLVETQMGSGTFISHEMVDRDEVERRRMLDQLCREFLSKASPYGFNLNDILENLSQQKQGSERRSQ